MASTKQFTRDEVAKHTSEQDCWMVRTCAQCTPVPFVVSEP
jgi:hypothetical protein